MMQLSRRHLLGLTVGAISAVGFRPAAADTGADIHGISAFGDLKYPADFAHFDYVKVDAPKGDTPAVDTLRPDAAKPDAVKPDAPKAP